MLNKILTILYVCTLSGILFGWGTQTADSGIVKNGLVAYWSFDKKTINLEGRDKWAKDKQKGLLARIHGDPELAEAADCVVNECLLFDGDVDRLLVKDRETFDRDWKEITLECWAYINTLDNSWNRIISLDNVARGNNNVAALYYDVNDRRHGFFVSAGGQSTDGDKDLIQEQISTLKWIHIAGVYDGKQVKYYKNGQLAKSYEHGGGKLRQGGLLLSIADRSDGCNCDTIQGYIDEVRIYDRALRAVEVANNFSSAGFAVKPSFTNLTMTWGDIKFGRKR